MLIFFSLIHHGHPYKSVCRDSPCSSNFCKHTYAHVTYNFIQIISYYGFLSLLPVLPDFLLTSFPHPTIHSHCPPPHTMYPFVILCTCTFHTLFVIVYKNRILSTLWAIFLIQHIVGHPKFQVSSRSLITL